MFYELKNAQIQTLKQLVSLCVWQTTRHVINYARQKTMNAGHYAPVIFTRAKRISPAGNMSLLKSQKMLINWEFPNDEEKKTWDKKPGEIHS